MQNYESEDMAEIVKKARSNIITRDYVSLLPQGKFFRMTEQQYLLQNSYFTFAGMCILFMGLYIFAYEKTETLLDVIKALMNPAVLYITSGGWFMENSLELSFVGNEFISIAVYTERIIIKMN